MAGVVSKQKVGIDVECIKKDKKISYGLFERIVDHNEQLILKDCDKKLAFFRAFTAKEAVLKLTGDGLKGLSKIKIKNIISDQELIIHYSDKKYLVENFYFDNYIVAVTKDKFNIKWTLEK